MGIQMYEVPSLPRSMLTPTVTSLCERERFAFDAMPMAIHVFPLLDINTGSSSLVVQAPSDIGLKAMLNYDFTADDSLTDI